MLEVDGVWIIIPFDLNYGKGFNKNTDKLN